MSSRVFQSVIVQMKEATDRMIGVIDADSTVISCSDTSRIGEKWPEAVIKLNSAPDSIVVVDKKTFKPLVSWSAYFDYAVFAEGDDEIARSLCVMAYVALNGAKTYYEESTTREPSSRISSPTTFCRAISISARRSCTSSPTRRALSSSSGR